VLQSKIQVLTVPRILISLAATLCRQRSLLTNDALILAMMHHHGFTHLASHDDDFDTVPGTTRYSPA
jgi:predicted nucleic acid-binding protein